MYVSSVHFSYAAVYTRLNGHNATDAANGVNTWAENPLQSPTFLFKKYWRLETQENN